MNKIIYSLQKMLQLVEMGFIPVATMKNPKYPEYDCWVFERSEEFDAALTIVLTEVAHEK